MTEKIGFYVCSRRIAYVEYNKYNSTKTDARDWSCVVLSLQGLFGVEGIQLFRSINFLVEEELKLILSSSFVRTFPILILSEIFRPEIVMSEIVMSEIAMSEIVIS